MGAPTEPGTLGEAIRRRRAALGWTQEELAERASAEGDRLRQSDISRLERGKVGLPHRERLERIAAALDLPLGELLARSGWSGATDAFPVTTVRAASGSRRDVLVADDEPATVDALAALLEAEGYRVSLRLVAVDTAEVARLAPDLIVLDFVFGAEHLGLELLQRLRMDRATAQIPAVVCSAALEAIRQMEGHLLGKGTGLVLKPFDADELLAEIDHAWAMLAEQRRAASPGYRADPADRVVAFPARPPRPPAPDPGP